MNVVTDVCVISPATTLRTSGPITRSLRRAQNATRTLNREGRSLPVELLSYIASLSSSADLRTLTETCKMLHNVAGTILYRAVWTDHRCAERVFSALLLRFQPGSSSHIRYPPLLMVQSISYLSLSRDDDIHILPLLCDVLLKAQTLRHLHIDIDHASCTPFLALVKRRELARNSPSELSSAINSFTGRLKQISCPLSLPRLQALRTSCFRMLGELGRHRALRAVSLDHGVDKHELLQLLETLTANGMASQITSFSCDYDFFDHSMGSLCAISVAFPRLLYLGLVVLYDFPQFYDKTYQVLSVRHLQILWVCPTEWLYRFSQSISIAH